MGMKCYFLLHWQYGICFRSKFCVDPERYNLHYTIQLTPVLILNLKQQNKNVLVMKWGDFAISLLCKIKHIIFYIEVNTLRGVSKYPFITITISILVKEIRLRSYNSNVNFIKHMNLLRVIYEIRTLVTVFKVINRRDLENYHILTTLLELHSPKLIPVQLRSSNFEYNPNWVFPDSQCLVT